MAKKRRSYPSAVRPWGTGRERVRLVVDVLPAQKEAVRRLGGGSVAIGFDRLLERVSASDLAQ